jgi:hypothetical protein
MIDTEDAMLAGNQNHQATHTREKYEALLEYQVHGCRDLLGTNCE